MSRAIPSLSFLCVRQDTVVSKTMVLVPPDSNRKQIPPGARGGPQNAHPTASDRVDMLMSHKLLAVRTRPSTKVACPVSTPT